jgi:transcriptional regulator with XRE-family HTH domain
MAVDLPELLRGMIIGPQIRAALALLNWTAADLTQASGVSGSAILHAEQARSVQHMRAAPNLFKLQRALEAAGIACIDADATLGAGVQLRQP